MIIKSKLTNQQQQQQQTKNLFDLSHRQHTAHKTTIKSSSFGSSNYQVQHWDYTWYMSTYTYRK